VSDLATITGKLGRYVKLLASDKDGEVLAAARTIVRTLKTAGADIHVPAEHIEGRNNNNNGTAKLTDAKMRKLYDAGYRDGLHAAETKQQLDEDGFRSAIPTPSAHEMALWCRERDDRLNPREGDFINQMASGTVWRQPTEKQLKWLKSIFLKLGGT
jgi:hypothetical protein